MDGEQHGLMGSLQQTREKNENSVNLKKNSLIEKLMILLINTLCSNSLPENRVLLLHK